MVSRQQITLTEEQNKVLNQLKAFIRGDDRVFVLKGYAGTGKTTLVRFIIDFLIEDKRMYKLLATTGRAAKILSDYSGITAGTIHHMIYKFKDLNKDLSDIDINSSLDTFSGQLMLVFEPVKTENTNVPVVYIVDESSMISDTASLSPTQAIFGEGKLLTELIRFDPNPQSKFVFVGDPCQLPPITSANSPALDEDYLRETFRFGVQIAELTQIMRQDGDNDITATAAVLRQMCQSAPFTEDVYFGQKVWGRKLPLYGRRNVRLHDSREGMLEHYFNVTEQKGRENVIYVCRTNRTCYELSTLIRRRLGYEGTLAVGDMLMVTQNQQTTGLMNGDMVEVVSIDGIQKKTGIGPYRNSFRFIRARVKELVSGNEHTTLILADTIEQNQNPDSFQQTDLFLDFVIRMKKEGVTQKSNPQYFADKLREDPYLNALHACYGYAVTCHKSQGGEWDDVFIDIPGNMTLRPTKEKFQWIYTALTRAKQTAHFVNGWYIEQPL